MDIYFAKRAEQPRADTGHFATNGATSYEKSQFHTVAAHLERVKAAVARYNGETSLAEIHDAKASAHDDAAIKHLAADLKT